MYFQIIGPINALATTNQRPNLLLFLHFDTDHGAIIKIREIKITSLARCHGTVISQIVLFESILIWHECLCV